MATIRSRVEAWRWYLYEKGVHPSVISEIKNLIECPFGTGITGGTNIGDLDTTSAVSFNQTGRLRSVAGLQCFKTPALQKDGQRGSHARVIIDNQDFSFSSGHPLSIPLPAGEVGARSRAG